MSRQKKNADDHPTVRAANIASSTAKKVALITVTGTIIAALIGGLWYLLFKTPAVEKKKFIGRVSDKNTVKPIKDAKVSLEGSEVPPLLYTDSEGVFSFPLNDLTKEIRIRVEKYGYVDFNLRVTPAENIGIQDIRLQPSNKTDIQQAPEEPKTSAAPTIPTLRAPERDVSKYIRASRSFFEKGQYDAALSECKKALRYQPNNQEALQLKDQIERTIRILNKK